MRRAVLALALCAFALAVRASGVAELTLKAVDGRTIALSVELASTPAERQKGLMGRPAMPVGHGMLFDFERDDQLVMWMKDTLIPLDMVFIAANGVVVDVIAHTTPLSETFLPARQPARYVIELNAGEAAQSGLAPGARLQLPLRASAISP